MADTNLRARGSITTHTLVAIAFLLAAVLIGCGAPADPARTQAVQPTAAGAVSSPGAQLSPGAETAPGETPQASAARTPGPSVPRVPPLQPPPFASRIEIVSMGIDLPVISGDVQPPPSYPFCDVAAYVTRFNQPYEPGITYISAHAQQGMFLPLLRASERDDGHELLGMSVNLYVSDGRLFSYEVNRVVRHATDYSALNELDMAGNHIVLQTSEGPYGTLEKLQVFAVLTGESTVDLELANPAPMPRNCEPDVATVSASPTATPASLTAAPASPN